jgi:tetratricopeptide (TPR) repeat protein
MPAQPFSGYTDPLASVSQNRAQGLAELAQYSIIRAAEFLRDNRQEEAIGEFKRALSMDPQHTTATTYIGNISLSLGKNEEAIAAFKDLVRQRPNSADAHIKLANAYVSNKQYDFSETEFKTAARLDPQNPVADYTLGMQYLQTGKLKEAENQFFKVQRIAPGEINAYYGLGATYNAQGNYDKAVSTLKTAVSLAPNNSPATYELGYAYNKLGDRDAAQAQLKKLTDARSPLAQDLSFEVNKPRMLWIDPANTTLNTTLGAGTPVWYMDTSLLTADSNASFSVAIQFSTQMDVNSVMNPSNWSISRARNTAGGYYNNMAPIDVANEASIPPTPTSVTYNSISGVAIVNFSVSQNSDITATLDPGHLVFKFSGKDAYGRSMDPKGNENNGRSTGGF